MPASVIPFEEHGGESRRRPRFRRAIYFHLGGLDLYPVLPDATHTNP